MHSSPESRASSFERKAAEKAQLAGSNVRLDFKKHKKRVFFLNSAYLSSGVLKVERSSDGEAQQAFKSTDSRQSVVLDNNDQSLPTLHLNSKKRGSSTNISSVLQKNSFDLAFRRERTSDGSLPEPKKPPAELSITLNDAQVINYHSSSVDRVDEAGEPATRHIQYARYFPSPKDDLVLALDRLVSSIQNMPTISLSPSSTLPNLSALSGKVETVLKDLRRAEKSSKPVSIRDMVVQIIFEVMNLMSQFAAIVSFVRSIQDKISRQLTRLDPDCSPDADLSGRIEQLIKVCNEVVNSSTKESLLADAAIDVIVEKERQLMQAELEAKKKEYHDTISSLKKQIKSFHSSSREGSSR